MHIASSEKTGEAFFCTFYAKMDKTTIKLTRKKLLHDRRFHQNGEVFYKYAKISYFS